MFQKQLNKVQSKPRQVLPTTLHQRYGKTNLIILSATYGPLVVCIFLQFRIYEMAALSPPFTAKDMYVFNFQGWFIQENILRLI